MGYRPHPQNPRPPTSVRRVEPVIGLLAMQMAAAVDAHPADVALTRELRLCLSHLAESPNDPPGTVDEIRANFLKSRVQLILDHSQGVALRQDDVVTRWTGRIAGARRGWDGPPKG